MLLVFCGCATAHQRVRSAFPGILDCDRRFQKSVRIHPENLRRLSVSGTTYRQSLTHSAALNERLFKEDFEQAIAVVRSGNQHVHMDRDQLRALQAPLKQEYRQDPDSAPITLRADGSLEERVACSVSTGTALVEAGLHPATGGTGLAVCSGDMLLKALVACGGVTLTAVATALGVKVRSGRVTAEGDLDVRGTLGIENGVPVGFK